MELTEETATNLYNSNVYSILTTRIKEYTQHSQLVEKPKTVHDDNTEVYISLISMSILFTSLTSIGLFRVGLLNTLIICLVVLALLVFGYVNFVKSTYYI